MKNKKGFTLVELLAVIAILAILATIATPIVLTVQKNIKTKMYDAKAKMIREAAVLYAEKKRETDDIIITIRSLCTAKFLDVDKDCNGTNCQCQLNPVKNASMDTCSITITYNNGRHKAIMSTYGTCGKD